MQASMQDGSEEPKDEGAQEEKNNHFHEWRTVMTCKICGIRNEILNYQKGWNNCIDFIQDHMENVEDKKKLENWRK